MLKLGKLLGKGSDGSVYEILEREELAVKYVEIGPHGIQNYLEYYILLHIKHPNIQHAIKITKSKKNLMKILQPKATCDLDKVTKLSRYKKKIITNIVKSVKHLSDRQIIHGDIKPSNILYFGKDDVRISDFSLSRPFCSVSKRQLYSYYYRAPEIDQGKIYPEKSDVYALGCTLYEIYFRRKYFDRKYSSKIHVPVNIKEEDKPFMDLIYNMTNENYEKRFDMKKVSEHMYFTGTHFLDKEYEILFDKNANKNKIFNNVIQENFGDEYAINSKFNLYFFK